MKLVHSVKIAISILSFILLVNLLAMYWIHVDAEQEYIHSKSMEDFVVIGVTANSSKASNKELDLPCKTINNNDKNNKILNKVWKRQKKIEAVLNLFPSLPNNYFELAKNFSSIDNKLSVLDFSKSTEERLIKQLKTEVKSYRDYTKSILVYFHDKELTNANFMTTDCPVKNCKFKHKAKDYETADAVLFKEIPEHLKDLKRPARRPDQLWIYYQLEAPIHTVPVLEGKIINWTATYRQDSVLQTPYGKFSTKRIPDKSVLRNIFAESKTKLIAWFVSNCKDNNGRMNYVKELQKYIQVDIYGHCGTLTCNRKDSNKCEEMLRKDYKFYLAFENTNCIDYITEKFFKTFSSEIVPIVMGAPFKDYLSIAPEHSFIHVDQFDSPKQLAQYLLLLNKDDSMYNQYFEWKATHEIINTKFMCRLCILLETAPYIKMRYHDINNWWREGQCLKKKKHQNWTSWK